MLTWTLFSQVFQEKKIYFKVDDKHSKLKQIGEEFLGIFDFEIWSNVAAVVNFIKIEALAINKSILIINIEHFFLTQKQ